MEYQALDGGLFGMSFESSLDPVLNRILAEVRLKL